MPKKPQKPFNPQTILIRSPNWVGDVVMATPAFRAVRNRFPNARITLLIKKYARCLVNDSPWFDEVVEYDPAGEHRGVGGYMRLVRSLRRRKFDLALILVNSMRGATEAFVSGARRRVGYNRNTRRVLLSDPVAPPMENGRIVPQNMVDYYLRLCREIGCGNEPTREELFVRPEVEARADDFLARHGRDASKMLIGINPGAAFGSSKCWLPERFARVADSIIERYGCELFICSAPSERGIAHAIESQMRHRPINPCDFNPGLEVYKAIVKKMRLLVTNDTGTRHIAVAFGVPVVVIFGSTNTRYTDVNLEKTVIVKAGVPCAPCQKKVCPTGDHRCMKDVTAEMVLAGVKRAMGLSG